MPTSKDVLDTAAKTLKDNAIVELALKDTVNQGTADIAACAKAKAELRGSVNSMKTAVATLEDKIKELNKGLTALEKNEAIMKAPADAKAYKKLQSQFADSIKTAMTYSKQLDAAIKKAEDVL